MQPNQVQPPVQAASVSRHPIASWTMFFIGLAVIAIGPLVLGVLLAGFSYLFGAQDIFEKLAAAGFGYGIGSHWIIALAAAGIFPLIGAIVALVGAIRKVPRTLVPLLLNTIFWILSTVALIYAIVVSA